MEMIGFYSDKWFSQKYFPLLGPFYPNKGNFIALIGNVNSKDVFDSVGKVFKGSSEINMVSLLAPDFIPGINFSDHASFWAVNNPALMITDTAYLRNSHYHKTTDTYRTLDYDKMALIVSGLTSWVVHY